ncbi:MAG: histidine phosphatase family protein [Deltaproteobacteria bacterium]|nr:histidine phosphatase family protein [Deltaproteobacteria bacterium]
MELILIRHGLPYRVEKKDGTAADPELSPKGIEQAQKLARWLQNQPLDAIYCSPLMRARMTAEPLSDVKGLDISIEPDVAEIDAQASTYIPLEELKKNEPEKWRELLEVGMEAVFDGMQDLKTFRRKIIKRIKQIVADNKGRKVAIVCHGGIINIWAAHILGLEKSLFFKPDYTSISRFMASGSGVHSLVSLNETGHLHGD